jgi:hypothetical protein
VTWWSTGPLEVTFTSNATNDIAGKRSRSAPAATTRLNIRLAIDSFALDDKR